VCRAAEGDAKIKSVEELLNEASSLLSKVSNGETIGESIPTMQQSVEELEQLGYVCDESGCVLVLPHERESAKGEPCTIPFNRLIEGSNWSIGKIPEATDDEFCAIVGGPYWSIPMRPKELNNFLEVLESLRTVVDKLKSQDQWLPGSADRPVSRVKWDSDHITLQATYAPSKPHFAMEMTFRTSLGRSVSTTWPAAVVAEVVEAIDKETGNTRKSATAAPAAVSA